MNLIDSTQGDYQEIEEFLHLTLRAMAEANLLRQQFEKAQARSG